MIRNNYRLRIKNINKVWMWRFSQMSVWNWKLRLILCSLIHSTKFKSICRDILQQFGHNLVIIALSGTFLLKMILILDWGVGILLVKLVLLLVLMLFRILMFVDFYYLIKTSLLFIVYIIIIFIIIIFIIINSFLLLYYISFF
jgi:hypothetical protein